MAHGCVAGIAQIVRSWMKIRRIADVVVRLRMTASRKCRLRHLPAAYGSKAAS
jgi:hypothetical protein